MRNYKMERITMIPNRRFHQVASIFPMMGEEEFAALKSDIQANGLLEPIWVDKDGLIIDGRNRYLACDELDIEPEYRRYTGTDGSLIAFVASLNLKRRHLNQLQKAIIAIDIEKQLAIEAKGRQRKAGEHFGRGQIKKEDKTYLFESEEKLVEKFQQPINFKIMDNKSSQQAAKILGTNQHYVADAKRIAATAPDIIQAAMAGKIKSMSDALKIAKLPEQQREQVLGKVDTGLKPADAIRETFREKIRTELESVEMKVTKEIAGIYDVIIIDPPWPAKKIERDVTPTQVESDYPLMSLTEIRNLKIPYADDCHLWLWTTQKFLPDSFDIIKTWGLKYVCTFVWHKPGGFQPIGLPQFNSEFVLYCRKGSPQFLDTKDLPTCFNAPRTGHSVKPQAFYDMVRRATSGRRLDMFSRRKIEGFETWGKECVE
jgi:N6-adenosine-specific RNA methylase IME4